VASLKLLTSYRLRFTMRHAKGPTAMKVMAIFSEHLDGTGQLESSEESSNGPREN